MGLFDELFGTDKEKENKSFYTDEELDNYGLEDWQKELVKKGEYEPWNFDEENLEEEDYYYEDDDLKEDNYDDEDDE